ncbi:RecB family exonuclease [Cellulomonas timonensis]|uniref:RecB family exonuclease n=1 Tax=Cellulomonas timonensis TaxID=1689271 RepID=UPI0009ED6BA0
MSTTQTPLPPSEPPSGEAPAARRSVPGLSPSRANDFLQCPLLFRFRVVDRLPEPPSAAAVRGTLVHAVLEHLFDLPAGQRTLAAAHAMLPARWEELLAAQPRHAELFEHEAEWDEWLASAGRLLDTYFTLEDPNRLQPHEREMSVRTQLDDGPQLRGIVDRLDVAPNGAMRVVDYKTGRSPRAGYESSALFQMRFYAFMLWRERGELPRMLQLVYLGDGTILRHEPTEPEMLSLEARVRSIWTGIEETARSGDWRPRKSKLCDWCAHRDLCPAFGGTPPEIPEGAVRLALGVEPVVSGLAGLEPLAAQHAGEVVERHVSQ